MRCDDCGEQASTEFEDEAHTWAHVCNSDLPSSETITAFVSVARDFSRPPIVKITGDKIAWKALHEIRSILGDVISLSYRSRRDEGVTWRELVTEGHEHRRSREMREVIEQAEDLAAHPHECPGCTNRFGSVRGLKQHMRCCYRIDPHALKRGEYDNLIRVGP